MELNIFNPSALLSDADEMDFLSLSTFDAGETGAFWSNPGFRSPWEMHLECDELLHIIEGKIAIEVLPRNGGKGVSKTLGAGSFIVIPKGCWHRQTILEKTKEFYLTPGPTLHSEATDPRAE